MSDLSVSLAGLQRASASVDQTARRIASATTPPSQSAPTDIVDLSAEMVALMQAKTAFAANANVIRAQDGLDQSLLNIIGLKLGLKPETLVPPSHYASTVRLSGSP